MRFSKRFWLIYLLMILPWLWVGIGLYLVHDYRITIALYAGFGCILPSWWLGRRHLAWGPLRYPVRGLIAWILLGHAVFYVCWSIFSPMMLAGIDLAGLLRDARFDFEHHYWFFLAYFITGNPTVEEVFWRGTIYRELREEIGDKPAWVVSSVFFGFWHWPVLAYAVGPVWATVVATFLLIAGLVLCHLYRLTNTLSAPIVVHSLAGDLPIAIIIYSVFANPLA